MKFPNSTMVSDTNYPSTSNKDNNLCEKNEDRDNYSLALYQTEKNFCSAVHLRDEELREVEQSTSSKIAVQNSENVHFGNKTYYEEPVTITRIMVPKPEIVTPIPGNHSKLSKKDILYAGLFFVFLLLLLISVVIKISNKAHYHFPKPNHEQDVIKLSDYKAVPNVTVRSSNKLIIRTRQEWLARAPKHTIFPLKTPVPYVIIWDTVSENCTEIQKCVYLVRRIQKYHMDSNDWSDIGYNFLVGGDGYAYEGRGFKNVGAHTYGYNSNGIGIAFIGTFNDIKAPQGQLLAAQRLISKGVEDGYIAKDYKLIGSNQVRNTTSPGQALIEIIKTWPHWSPTPNTYSSRVYLFSPV